jgi:DNA-binding transcriptional MocR family regulator
MVSMIKLYAEQFVRRSYMPFNSFENYPMTWKPRINRNDKPLYKILADILETDIHRGILKPGDKLPPQRELADYLDLNLSTITRAFKLCEMKGLIYGIIGGGTYVSQDVHSRQPMLPQKELYGLINLGASHPLSTQNSVITKTMKQVLKRTNVEKLLSYEEPLGKRTHIETGVKWLAQFGISSIPEEIMITSGLQNSLTVIMVSLFEAGDKIAVPNLIYPGFKNIANLLGIRLIPIPIKDTCIDSDILIQKCKLENIKGIYLSPDYHNPTTLCMSEEDRQRIAKIIQEFGLICIEDGTYSFLKDSFQMPLCSYLPQQCIYVSTISNAFCAGLRIAFLKVPDTYRVKIEDGIRNVNVMSSPFDAETASRLIDSGLAVEIINRNKIEIRNRNRITNEYLHCFNIHGDDNSQFRWLILPSHRKSSEFEHLALKNGVEVFSSERFAVGNATLPSAIRIAITSPKSIDELENGLSVLQKLLTT